ncbi:hypothetical protein Rcae01_05904 [Novipirellula caenicola]|uniref:Uncharacterized protein n=1 Tax=Novipirellula caenicola TaxID=1536901 RepID=A0ABP9W0A6_9BACT
MLQSDWLSHVQYDYRLANEGRLARFSQANRQETQQRQSDSAALRFTLGEHSIIHSRANLHNGKRDFWAKRWLKWGKRARSKG